MSTEKSSQSWTKAQRLEAIMDCHSLNDDRLSSYCRENGIYPHHVKEWKSDFLSENQASDSTSRQEQKKLKQENKRLQKELNRKDRGLSETAALLVLSKKSQAIWVGGRLTSYPDRKQYCALIDEAVQNGARQQLSLAVSSI
ncbi:MAG: transposase [Gammaproteobacteria bacterium]|nr:transposase [Gammaproteobacteria bacterium]MBT5221574.1 transposase [Gammaproteobacteria bacterium]MBT5824782.1 transposase [Gammaproteobacteria bacterium]MBT6419853.1 transposase [Gammaproteobacteria bacterium]MBT6575795.1 transposase [Gammaproteobacteria bacterium]